MNRRPSLVLLVVLLPLFYGTFARRHAINVTSSDGTNCAIKANGCSVPGKLPFFYKKKFTPACRKHDVCYSCGELYGWTRPDCDHAFKTDMNYLCTVPSTNNFVGIIIEAVRKLIEKNSLSRCLGFASIYFQVVEKFGSYYYNEQAPDWCRQHCVVVYGSPQRRLGQGYNNA